jgi:hypothetical protein
MFLVFVAQRSMSIDDMIRILILISCIKSIAAFTQTSYYTKAAKAQNLIVGKYPERSVTGSLRRPLRHL